MTHSDITGATRCPTDLCEYLLKIGGKVPGSDDKPMWRLAVAESIVWRVRGGKVWDDSLTVNERGGIGNEHRKPLRDDSDKLVERRRYPWLTEENGGWILQRWFPPSKYSRAQWFAPENCLPDGTPFLGPYPENGDYEMIDGPFKRLPSHDQLYQFITRYWHELESRTGTVETRMRDAASRAQHELKEAERRVKAEMAYRLHDASSYIRSSSLEAGRERVRRGDKLGIKEHIGA